MIDTSRGSTHKKRTLERAVFFVVSFVSGQALARFIRRQALPGTYQRGVQTIYIDSIQVQARQTSDEVTPGISTRERIYHIIDLVGKEKPDYNHDADHNNTKENDYVCFCKYCFHDHFILS